MNSRRLLSLAFACAALGAFAAGLALPVINGGDDLLEPSIQNEVDHALDLGERWLADFARTNRAACATNACATNSCAANSCATNSCAANACAQADLFGTNSLTREQIALKLVRAQRASGHWSDPTTNNLPPCVVTRLAVSILAEL